MILLSIMRFSVRSRLKIILFIQEVFELRTMTTEEQRKTNGGYKIYEYYRCDTCKKGVGYLKTAMWLFKITHEHTVEYHWVDNKGKVH